MSALHIAASHPNTAEDSPALVAALLAAGADPDVAGLLVQNIG
jgi:ankyrin repeat protein